MKTIITIAAMFFGTYAYANSTCGLTATAFSSLTYNYGEEVVQEMDYKGYILRMWVNEETGSWTLTTSNGEGISCLVAGGTEGYAGQVIEDFILGEEA